MARITTGKSLEPKMRRSCPRVTVINSSQMKIGSWVVSWDQQQEPDKIKAASLHQTSSSPT